MSYGKWKALQPRVDVEVDYDKPLRPCGICGADMPPEVNGNAKYCSYECKLEAQCIKNKERYLKNKMKAATRFCNICGKEIPYDANRHIVYCSDQCKREGSRIRGRERYRIKKERMMANGKV